MNNDLVKTTLKHENKVQSFLRDLNKSGALTDEQCQELSPTGYCPGILYGLPKIHKPNITIRPILSAIGRHLYKLAKFLVSGEKCNLKRNIKAQQNICTKAIESDTEVKS